MAWSWSGQSLPRCPAAASAAMVLLVPISPHACSHTGMLIGCTMVCNGACHGPLLMVRNHLCPRTLRPRTGRSTPVGASHSVTARRSARARPWSRPAYGKPRHFFGDHLSRRSRPVPPYSRRVMCSTVHACMHAYRMLIGACDPNFMADARLQAPTPLRPLCARPDGSFCRPEFCGMMQTAVMCGNFDIVWSRLSRGSQLQTTLHVPCDIRGVVPICIGWC